MFQMFQEHSLIVASYEILFRFVFLPVLITVLCGCTNTEPGFHSMPQRVKAAFPIRVLPHIEGGEQIALIPLYQSFPDDCLGRAESDNHRIIAYPELESCLHTGQPKH